MKNDLEKIQKSLQKLKVFEINRLQRLKKEQEKFIKHQEMAINDLRNLVLSDLKSKKEKDDLLSPKQVINELGISRKTFDRWVIDGLAILQRNPGASIRVKREELEGYLKDTYDVR